MELKYFSLRSKLNIEKICIFDSRTIPKKFCFDIYIGLRATEVWILHFGLRGQIWPRRSKFRKEKSSIFDSRTMLNKFCLDIYNGLRVTSVWIFRFGLRGQVWPPRPKFILQNLCQFSQRINMQNLFWYVEWFLSYLNCSPRNFTVSLFHSYGFSYGKSEP